MTGKISQITERSPLQLLALARQSISASWSLRRATSIGKHNRLVGRLRVRNSGRLIIGNKVFFHTEFADSIIVVKEGAELKIGDQAYINYGADICAHKRIEIGERCRIGTHCIIMDSDFHHVELERRDERPPAEAVIIEPEVWIGNRVTILKGVRIGYGSVVAAGSVVTKSIPPMSIAAGVPAKVIRPITRNRELQTPMLDKEPNGYCAELLVVT